MTNASLCARHYLSGQPVRITWNEDRILSLTEAGETETQNRWIAPSLFDLQINGYAGIDFQKDDLTLNELLQAARGLRRDGCARWFFTLITHEWPALLQRLRRARELRSQSPELHAAIAGWHIEGPFLSPEPGYAGAHRPAAMGDPSPAAMDDLRAVAGPDPVLLTLAPERSGSLEAIRRARELNIQISLGHTNANAERLRDAVSAGAAGFTHLGNGCPRDLNRHDNILWRVFETEGLTVSFIVDQIHVSPPLLRLAHRLLPAERIYYTTDAMAAAGAPPGRYRLGSMELDVGEDQVVRQPGSPLFAGSALRPLQGIERASAMLHQPWQQVWPFFSDHPARFMGLPLGIDSGRSADLCVLETTADNRILSCRFLPPAH